MQLREGDPIQVRSNKVAQVDRHGVVRRVLQEDPLRVEVEWDDGHTSIFVPHAGSMLVERRQQA
ncbi:DUF1918 domain-containing protein [Egicoccus sp. AB-alg6-2]|uniref:DUF1918 domain-containing protein n=1 Tax=Egicoccus sp. AB-alg6-2 TaxID=3242692 RepID=UPI00359DC980